jgi:hypothetical protein
MEKEHGQMKSKLKGMAAGIVLIALTMFLWQCTSWLVSTTLQITFYVEDGLYAVEDSVQMAPVDLTDNEDWAEHHDEVTGIQRVLFATWVMNRSAVDAIAQFYISADSALASADQVRDEATLILDGITVPADDSIYITAPQSAEYIRNAEELKDFLVEGVFSLYCIAEESPFEIEVPESVAVVIDFTYSPE